MLLVKDRVSNAEKMLNQVRDMVLGAATNGHSADMTVGEDAEGQVLTIRILPQGLRGESQSWQKLYSAIAEVKKIIDLRPQTTQVKIIADFLSKGVGTVKIETLGPSEFTKPK